MAIILVTSCGKPDFDVGDEAGRQAIKDQANLYLNYGQCRDAIDVIEPLYNSEHSDDETRLIRAGAHLCNAGVSNYWGFISSLTGTSLCSGTDCTAIWTTPTELFTVGALTASNKDELEIRRDSAYFAMDALRAVLREGVFPEDNYETSPGSYNVGSTRIQDRTDEANLYLVVASMAAVGAENNLWGQTAAKEFDSTYRRRADIGWNTAAKMDYNGCQYAAGVMNMLDSLVEFSSTLSIDVTTEAKTVLDTFCVTYCTTVCGIDAALCGNECPAEIRYRENCLDTNVLECNAAAIINFINTDASYGWPCVAGGC